MQRPTNSGFTLIELLVVIAIIAILAGRLLPALRDQCLPSSWPQIVSGILRLGVAVGFRQFHGGKPGPRLPLIVGWQHDDHQTRVRFKLAGFIELHLDSVEARGESDRFHGHRLTEDHQLDNGQSPEGGSLRIEESRAVRTGQFSCICHTIVAAHRSTGRIAVG